MDSIPMSSTDYVDADNGCIYRYVGTGSLTYAQAKTACQALSYPGLTGTAYPVVWNTWVAGRDKHTRSVCIRHRCGMQLPACG